MRSTVWVTRAAGVFTALFGTGTGVGAFVGHEEFAGFPQAAWPGLPSPALSPTATVILPGLRSCNGSA
jgi:hypothetical protein